MGDRLYCTAKLFRLLNEQECFGLFRRNKSLSYKKIRRLHRTRVNGAIIEDFLVKAGAGANAIELRLITMKAEGKTYEAFTNVMDTERLTAQDVVTLYPIRWQVERLFFDLKVVLKLQKFHAANPNAVAMQVFAGAMVHAAFRVAQADIPRLIRELRQRTGLTQEKFAAKLGVTFPTINRWENGRAKPSPLAIQRIEELLRGMGDNGSDLLKRGFLNR